jgi:hypothetical protein
MWSRGLRHTVVRWSTSLSLASFSSPLQFVHDSRGFFEFHQWPELAADVHPVELVGLADDNAFDVQPVLGPSGKGFEDDQAFGKANPLNSLFLVAYRQSSEVRTQLPAPASVCSNASSSDRRRIGGSLRESQAGAPQTRSSSLTPLWKHHARPPSPEDLHNSRFVTVVVHQRDIVSFCHGTRTLVNQRVHARRRSRRSIMVGALAPPA